MAERLRCIGLEIQWGFPAQVRTLLTAFQIYDQKLECVSLGSVATGIPLSTKIRSDMDEVAEYCSPGLVGCFVFSI